MNVIINASGQPWTTDEEIALGIPETKDGWRAERHLYRYITDNLPSNWTVVYDRTFQSASGQSAQIDFLVFVPGKGAVNVDAKGFGYKCVNGVVSLGVPGAKDVFNEAKSGIHVFSDYVKNYVTNTPHWGAFGELVVFTENNFSEELPGGVPYLQARDMENPRALEQAIAKCLEKFSWCFMDFCRWGNCIIEHLCKNVRSTPILLEQRQMDIFSRQGLDQEQQEICYLIEQHRYVHVHGGAGTGKTLIAMALAKEAAEKGLKTLYVCFNSSLAKFLQREMSQWRHDASEKLVITNFHTIGQRLLSKDFTVTTKNGFDRGATDEKIKNNLARELRRRHFDAFDVAMIDEAQDLTNDNIFTILTLLKPQRKVGIFSDSKQTLFTRNWELDSQMFDGGILEQRLNRNYRNTDKIFESFKQYSQESTVPMIRSCNDYVTKEVSVINRDMVCDVITEMLANGVRPSDIALISTSVDMVAEFKKKNVVNSMGVKVYFRDNLDKWYKGETILSTTIQSFKGLESKIVFFFATESCTNELKYVGQSRARFELYLVE